MEDYKIKIKDNTQNCVHTLTEHAASPNQANQQALKYLRKHIGNNDYEIKDCSLVYRKYTYAN